MAVCTSGLFIVAREDPDRGFLFLFIFFSVKTHGTVIENHSHQSGKSCPSPTHSPSTQRILLHNPISRILQVIQEACVEVEVICSGKFTRSLFAVALRVRDSAGVVYPHW